MSRRFIQGFAAFSTVALIAVLASSAVAQPARVPVQVVQASDGTLFTLQGNNSWTLIPDQISDSDVAALNPSGEIDGTFPNDVFVVLGSGATTAAWLPTGGGGSRGYQSNIGRTTPLGSCRRPTPGR